jgi:hypothetical protein
VNEKKAEIPVRAMNAANWRDLHAIWTGPLVIEDTRRRYAFREGEYVDARAVAWIGRL